MPAALPVIFTIGHSNHEIDHFFHLLVASEIKLLVDTRSSPYSRYSLQFNRDTLQTACEMRGIGYLFLGNELGGRPQGEEFYDPQGHVLYWKIAQSSAFREAIDCLVHLAAARRTAILCSEEDPTHCHRRLLVTRVLVEAGVEVRHIRGDGTITSESDLVRQLEQQQDRQQLLFALEDADEWKSTRSVLDKKLPGSSSGR